jgi:hypothetical protein
MTVVTNLSCDRCGKVTSGYQPEGWEHLVTHFLHTVATVATPPSHPNADLCPECVEQFNVWFSNVKKPKGKPRGTEGGHARADTLSPQRRSEIAKQAARARWDEKT